MQKPTEHSQRRQRAHRAQRGNALLVSLIALTGLGTLGVITVLSVSSGATAASADRSHAVAVYAAESGLMVGMRYLDIPTFGYALPDRFSPIVLSGANTYYDLPGLPGNRVQPGNSQNLFSPSMNAWYDVRVKNNPTDPKVDSLGNDEDSDGRIIFTSIGYGPGRASATLEAEVYYDHIADRFVILSWREVE